MAEEFLRPNADGDEGTPGNWQQVDEDPADDDTTFYFHNGALTTSMNVGPSALSTEEIEAVSCIVRARHTSGTGSGTVQAGLRLSGVNSMGSVQATTTSYQNFTAQPSRPGGGPWTVADLANLQARAITSEGGGANDLRVTQIYIRVQYAAIGSERKPKASSNWVFKRR